MRDSVSAPDFEGLASPGTSASTQTVRNDGDNSMDATAGKAVDTDDKTCNICNRHFGRAPDLRRHLRSHDPTERIYHCHIPGCTYKGSYRLDKLADHIKKLHSGIDA